MHASLVKIDDTGWRHNMLVHVQRDPATEAKYDQQASQMKVCRSSRCTMSKRNIDACCTRADAQLRRHQMSRLSRSRSSADPQLLQHELFWLSHNRCLAGAAVGLTSLQSTTQYLPSLQGSSEQLWWLVPVRDLQQPQHASCLTPAELEEARLFYQACPRLQLLI